MSASWQLCSCVLVEKKAQKSCPCQSSMASVVLSWCAWLYTVFQELTRREVEYIALSRDTTESDLKQRREIRSGTAYYVDQCAVRAATEGRVLVLEGIEKAERNVLPVLNNLLENRQGEARRIHLKSVFEWICSVRWVACCRHACFNRPLLSIATLTVVYINNSWMWQSIYCTISPIRVGTADKAQ